MCSILFYFIIIIIFLAGEGGRGSNLLSVLPTHVYENCYVNWYNYRRRPDLLNAAHRDFLPLFVFEIHPTMHVFFFFVLSKDKIRNKRHCSAKREIDVIAVMFTVRMK